MTTKVNMVHQEEDIRYIIDGVKLKDLAKYFEEQSSKFPEHAYVDIGTEDYYGDTSAYVRIIYRRPETKKEEEDRLSRERLWADQERNQYEKLKAKFEGNK